MAGVPLDERRECLVKILMAQQRVKPPLFLPQDMVDARETMQCESLRAVEALPSKVHQVEEDPYSSSRNG